MAFYHAYSMHQFASRRRWARVPAWQRHAIGYWLRRRKGALHGHRVQSRNGHFMYMLLCRRYKKRLGRPLTPADRAYIHARHAQEIADAARPLDESKRNSVQKRGAKDRR